MPDVSSHTVSPTFINRYPPSHLFHETGPQQPQWAYPSNTLSASAEPPQIFMSNGVSCTSHVPVGPSTHYGFKDLDPMCIDPTLNARPNWPYQSTDQQSTEYIFNDMLAGSISSSPAPLPPAHPSSGFASSSGLLGSYQRPFSAGRSSLSTIQHHTRTLSSRDQDDSTITSTAIGTAQTISPMTVLDSQSTSEASRDATELFPSARSKLTLTIEEPNLETMADLMSILAKCDAKAKLEWS